MDEEDHTYLKAFNGQQSQEHHATLTPTDFERIMDRFEQEYGVIEEEKMTESLLEGNVENLAFCSVCRDGDSEDTNEMLYCEKCNNAVHQACYGVKVCPFLPPFDQIII